MGDDWEQDQVQTEKHKEQPVCFLAHGHDDDVFTCTVREQAIGIQNDVQIVEIAQPGS